MNERHEYTVCFLFSSDLSSVLLVRKGATEFIGKLNGVGGELMEDEPPYKCADREILEETNVSQQDMRSLGLVRLAPLGTLELPHDCKYGTGSAALHYFAGVLKPDTPVAKETDRGEELVWEGVADVLASGVNSDRYAGKGDLPYFVNQGLMAVKRYLPEWAAEEKADG